MEQNRTKLALLNLLVLLIAGAAGFAVAQSTHVLTALVAVCFAGIGFLVTLVSLPAGSVPAGMTSDGLPVGLQIVATRFEEPKILSIVKLIQKLNPVGLPPA